MRTPRKTARDVFDNPVLVGAVTILLLAVAVYLSYIAENGLPFIPTYNIKVQIANADELVKNADIRIGGARIGQVLKITPEPANATHPHPYAQLQLQLEHSLEPLPSDTRYAIRLASILGGKYLEIIPGSDRASTIPDGGMIPISHENPVVDLDTAFRTFGPKTQSGLRGTALDLGNAVAGRGTDFNDAILGTYRTIGPAEDLLRILANPTTRLSQFLAGAAATTGALAPVAPTVSSLLGNGSTTFNALNKAALGQTIDQLPSTESIGTSVLTQSEPVLTDAAKLAQELEPGATKLPRATAGLSAIVGAATPVFARVPVLATRTESALNAVDQLAKTPAATEAFNTLGPNDLATVGASAFLGLGAILHAVAPAQLNCNTVGEWVNNIESGFSEGDAAGTWIRFSPVIDPTLKMSLLATAPSPQLHVDPYPIENASECQAGNQTYRPGQVIGNPGPTGKAFANTAPPAGVLARG
ncbi:MAG TPA: MlaD family protein, partial [Solirubrobacteraceae bacterium]|nr:MlaD family protein [Solirubrobacteraceae bacterium]